MKRSVSSRRWLDEHFNDPYVQKAKKEGYRSRAVYKLIELNQKDNFIKKGMTVVDLGAAPGSWCEILKELVGVNGKIIALDILPMSPLPGVTIIEGDFSEESVHQQLLDTLEGQSVDLVLSDMATNTSGMKAVDQPRAMHLVELALDFAEQNLSSQGTFVIKVFQGEGFDNFLLKCRSLFKRVVIRKPQASRLRSPEVYLIGMQLKNN